MKGLLHSKVFKANLRKWLCMYVGVMLLLTSVVTYSKYISQMNHDDSSRVTKFNVEINKTNKSFKNCKDENGQDICPTEAVRPTSEMLFYFTVSTEEVEVRADISITVQVAKQIAASNVELTEFFKNFKFDIYQVDNKGQEKPVTLSSVTQNTRTKTFNLTVDPTIPNNGTYKYVIKLKYDENVEFTNQNSINYDMITIGYSARQI